MARIFAAGEALDGAFGGAEKTPGRGAAAALAEAWGRIGRQVSSRRAAGRTAQDQRAQKQRAAERLVADPLAATGARPVGVDGVGRAAGPVPTARARAVERETAAERAVLRAVAIRGGEVCRHGAGATARWRTVDVDGRLTEELSAAAAERLADRGRLKLKRFGFDGAIYGVV